MKLPAKAKDDYPLPVGGVGGAKLLHILAIGEPWRAVCGVVTDGQENVGPRPRPVCVECRRGSQGEEEA
jgi:hypothetical protein